MKKRWHNFLLYISFIFLAFTLYKANYLKIPNIYSIIQLITSFGFLFLGFIINSISQQQFLAKSKFTISFPQALATVGLNIFGKYIPGKLWMTVGKAAYVSGRSNYSLVELSIAFLKAMVIGVWCGLMLGILGLFIANGFNYLSWVGLAIFIGLTAILFSQKTHDAALQFISRVFRKQIKIPALSIRSILSLIPWFLSSWLLWGFGFFLFAASITDHSLPLSISFCFPLAGTFGILFLLAPGGVGIREGIMVGYLSILHINLTEAITISTASRLWFLIGEMFIFATGFVASRWVVHSGSLKGKSVIH
jgi:uncharacterized membrane protein YbhN (UPF0104 family)